MRGVGSEPHLVGVVGGDGDDEGGVECYWRDGAGAVPAMHLDAAVDHGDASRAIVVGGRDVDPLACGGGRNESGIVEAVGMFVDQKPCLRGTRQGKVTEFRDVAVVG